LVARAITNGVKVKSILTYPFMRNVRTSKIGSGERRYGGGYLRYRLRKLRNINDIIRVYNFTPAYILREEEKIRPSVILALILSTVHTLPKALQGKNLEPVDIIAQQKIKYLLPEEVGLPKTWLFGWWERITLVLPSLKNVILRIIRKAGNCTIAILTIDKSLAIFRDEQIFLHWLDSMKTLATYIKSDSSEIRLLHYPMS